ncbi:Eco57I restriction-modification methylase domain-containing protein [Pseudonocardia sp. McavD-2-B]|uniref:Eco57I restriction-modification methylase domain-containing protein n=1 Tax=Pseudonocardia sp. McavD-2-B TaxID=2954499 RepID=UPI002096A27F|nr:type IIL restriction-modification enzyme MmeI [Pseudonocardia sp. McavD-2-B]MCO7191817.1 SAM-dependent DNA methyltransferase [Pseudonocardia sp. McavD-2-B]
MTRTTTRRRTGAPPVDAVAQHRDWLALVEVDGPFLSLPVLRRVWPALEALEPAQREALRREHSAWRDDPTGGREAWVRWVLTELLGWGAELSDDVAPVLRWEVPEHDTVVTPTHALVAPDSAPERPELLVTVLSDGSTPTSRIPDSSWAATPVDRTAQLCRAVDVELGLVTDGRWWVLVWAPRGGVTTTAVFDAIAWPEAAERGVVRAWTSILGRTRFFGVPVDERLPALLRESESSQEEITEALGVQVRRAVELLVAQIGRADVAERAAGGPGLAGVDAHEVYRGAVSVMMRVVFLLYAEERGLLPSDNDLYASVYSAGRLCAELERRAQEGSEDELENSTAAWHRLLALFTAVHGGVDHPRLHLHAHDGSLFDPETYPWMPLGVDDRTVLHMLRAVQHVEVGTGRNRERRTLSFRQLDVEQIGYVYEGLLSFEGLRAGDVVLGLVGKVGTEAEVPLSALEDLARRHRGRPLLAAAIAEQYKGTGIGSARAIERRLTEPDAAGQEERRRKLLAVTEGDAALVERLLPFHGLVREDLRDLPVVILPGALYVTESSLRGSTGTHYTPRKLAEEVVRHALHPLLYHHENGPLQTEDSTRWVPRSSAELLELSVADIAMGSAAFLVAAARYLGAALVDAWVREGRAAAPAVDEHRAPDSEDDELTVRARREVIEHCLYGVDINPMAVEMAKLSLWLVSLDPRRPFTFLDDRLVAGDSLLGITSTEQLEYLHLDPVAARKKREGTLDFSTGARSVVSEAAEIRRRLRDVAVDGGAEDALDALETKRALLADAELQTSQQRLFADLVVGAALAASRKGLRNSERESLVSDAEILADKVAAGEGEMTARERAREWLDTGRPADAFARSPLHWPLVFPEVVERGGFDAVIGNPPFLGGQKLTGSLGTAYRELLVSGLGGGTRGSADLVAYFVLQAHRLLTPNGQTGLLATNTLAQGDTREVGLDRLVAEGTTIRRAVKSEPWPSRSAVLEYAAVWTSRAVVDAAVSRYADGLPVSGVTASLEAQARVVGNPHRLVANTGLAFQGSNILGLGFTMEPERARELIDAAPRNADVLFPYLNGQDLNSDPDCAASRWVINFHDWSEGRARQYPEPYRQVRELVKPERERNNDRRRREIWWRFTRPAPELYDAIAGLKQAIALTLVSKTVMPALVPTGQVFSHMLGVFATDATDTLALLSSAPHYWWTVARASSMKADLRYTPSDVFETFPRPEPTTRMRELGDELDTHRRSVMQSRRTGLTKTYNLVFDPEENDADLVELRRIHRDIDLAVLAAYGWGDIDPEHGFHPAGRDLRYTIGPTAQREVLDRLLELNHERYADEVARGLHEGKKRRPRPEDDE